MIRFHCNKCGQSIKAPDKYAGKKVKCPKCSASNILPSDEEALPYQLEVDTNDYECIFCQQCGNKIKKDAFICPKCGCKNNLSNNSNNNFTPEVKTGTIVAAYFLCFFIPLFGIIAGIYLMCKDKIAHGIACVLLSMFIGIPFSLALMSSSMAV